MPKPLVFDSTPLIYLAKTSLAEFLKELSQQKFTTKSVFEEIVVKGKKKKAIEASLLENLFKEQIIKIHNINQKEYFSYVTVLAAESEMHPLHVAEAEVLCLAKELNGIVIADDQAARSVARLLGIESHGTGYILGKIYATKKIDREKLIEKVKEMRDCGWYVLAEDYLKIIDCLRNLKI
jgi:predicted nucleic acid-binding protein